MLLVYAYACVCVSVCLSERAPRPKINLNNIANLLWNKMSANSSEHNNYKRRQRRRVGR